MRAVPFGLLAASLLTAAPLLAKRKAAEHAAEVDVQWLKEYRPAAP